jgi:hypothetical protein
MAGRGPVGDQESIFEDDEEFSSGRSAVRIASVAALGGLLFGYHTAVINGANAASRSPCNRWRTCTRRSGATNPRRRADVAAVSETRVTAPSLS